MNKLKSTAAILILLFALIGAYFIISNYNSSEPAEKNIIEEAAGNNPVGIETISADTSKNLTDILTQKIEESIGKENTEGFKTLNGQTLISAPKPEQLVEELIAEAQKNFDPESLRPKISDSSLKISEDNSREALIKYFASFNSILIEASKNIPKTLFDENKMSISDFLKTKIVYEETANSFYGLTAPRSILDIHKKELELLLTKKNIFEKMANADQDPMTAFLAVDELLKIDLEFATLKENIETWIKEHNL